jgi:hypothetical protein
MESDSIFVRSKTYNPSSSKNKRSSWSVYESHNIQAARERVCALKVKVFNELVILLPNESCTCPPKTDPPSAGIGGDGIIWAVWVAIGLFFARTQNRKKLLALRSSKVTNGTAGCRLDASHRLSAVADCVAAARTATRMVNAASRDPCGPGGSGPAFPFASLS